MLWPASSQYWLQYFLSLGTVQTQAGWAHFLGVSWDMVVTSLARLQPDLLRFQLDKTHYAVNFA